MSEKREKRRRYIMRLAYIRDFKYWLACEPPLLLFWRWRKWLKERPVPKYDAEIAQNEAYREYAEAEL